MLNLAPPWPLQGDGWILRTHSADSAGIIPAISRVQSWTSGTGDSLELAGSQPRVEGPEGVSQGADAGQGAPLDAKSADEDAWFAAEV